MNENEARMKERGENKVWKNIISKSGSPKLMPQTQLGQQLIFEDALNILHLVRGWIEEKSSTRNRIDLKAYFVDDEILLQKITETFLLLASSTYVIRGMNENKVKTRHKSVTLINKKILPDLDFDLTWRFLEVVVEASKYFNKEKCFSTSGKGLQVNMYFSCSLPEIIVDKLSQEAHSAFFPEPMLTPPIKWTFKNYILKGGFEYYQYEMIRTKTIKTKYNKYPQNIFDALNFIQRTSWKINKHILHAVNNDLKVPLKEDFVKMAYPESEKCQWDIKLKDKDSKVSEEVVEKIKKERAIFTEQLELYNAEVCDFESAMGKYRAVKLATGIAERYQDEPNIYFPHSYDSRGRVYPIPVGLSPQGSDAVKAMLEYTKGEVLNEDGIKWAWSYLASLYGDDKIDFEARILRGKELINEDYKNADEPYQFLAHQLELKKFLKDPNYEFKGRIHLDACNSGSQFTSAFTGDIEGCKATNVIPTFDKNGNQIRQDAYLLVSAKSLQKTIEMIKATQEIDERVVLRFFKQLLLDNGRKVCKKPVMVSNYGGTAGGRSKILWSTLRDLKCDRVWITKKNAALFSKIIGGSIQGVLKGGKAFEQYIQKMNNLIAKGDNPVTWTTLDGFYVVHVKNKELQPKQVSCLLPQSRKPTIIYKKVFSKSVSSTKMKSAISPNYVHSNDATLLRCVALRMKELDIDTDWIHDSFGCLPNHVSKMLNFTKEEFIKLIQSNPLKELDRQLCLQITDSKPNLKKLKEIVVPHNDNFDNNLKELMKSNWFFS